MFSWAVTRAGAATTRSWLGVGAVCRVQTGPTAACSRPCAGPAQTGLASEWGPDEPRAAARQRRLSWGGGHRRAGPVRDVPLFVLAPSEGGHCFKVVIFYPPVILKARL